MATPKLVQSSRTSDVRCVCNTATMDNGKPYPEGMHSKLDKDGFIARMARLILSRSFQARIVYDAPDGAPEYVWGPKLSPISFLETCVDMENRKNNCPTTFYVSFIDGYKIISILLVISHSSEYDYSLWEKIS